MNLETSIVCATVLSLRARSADRGVARMAGLGVRSGALAFARSAEDPTNKRFERTGANGRERAPALAMQKVVGSSPIIRSRSPPETAGFLWTAVES
jgi:hypothetical protein